MDDTTTKEYTAEQVVSQEYFCSYIPEKKWYVWVDQNNVIQKTISSIFELSGLETNQDKDLDLRVIRIGCVTEPLYNVLSKVASKPYYIGVIDEDAQEIYSFKFKHKITGGVKNDDKYIIDDALNVNFMLLDELDNPIDYNGSIILKCINTKTVNKQYTINSANNTLQNTGDHSREYTIHVDDTLTINNSNIVNDCSIRVICNFFVNGCNYPLVRYITFGAHD